ncbi:hypothetical protein AVEN_258765-1 [Araneus ventricosus]|uniref:Uncharacterized protein n=1 Tax=Araneus ventricosus TaxID=182803 RepID=A0A4Y2D3M0_ARAVE|nr:hypothetical protein AVEN_258765-1 [Araneus ventricosus]
MMKTDIPGVSCSSSRKKNCLATAMEQIMKIRVNSRSAIQESFLPEYLFRQSKETDLRRDYESPFSLPCLYASLGNTIMLKSAVMSLREGNRCRRNRKLSYNFERNSNIEIWT